MVDVDFFVQNFTGDKNARTTNKCPIEVQIGLSQEE
jgi:hypothetical protein